MRKSTPSRPEYYNGKHRFEHWYRDNTVYFITARCRDKFPCFSSEDAKAVFWDRFSYYTDVYCFIPWVTTLLNNHYHTLGYLKKGRVLGKMMQRIHGSVAKLVNDTLVIRQVPFWRDAESGDYFDGCIRDVKQCERAYNYTLRQSVRHRICRDWREYKHTRVNIDLQRGLRRALELKCFLPGVPYKRYQENQPMQISRPVIEEIPHIPDLDEEPFPEIPDLE